MADSRRADAQTRDELLDLARDGAMSVADACQFVGVRRSSMYELIASGAIATARIGRRRVVLRRSAIELLARRAD